MLLRLAASPKKIAKKRCVNCVTGNKAQHLITNRVYSINPTDSATCPGVYVRNPTAGVEIPQNLLDLSFSPNSSSLNSCNDKICITLAPKPKQSGIKGS